MNPNFPAISLGRRLLAVLCLVGAAGTVDLSNCRAEAEDVGGPPGNSRHLQPLEWLLGEWVGAIDGGVVMVSSHWNDGGHYIVREFLLRRDDGIEVGATQRIGWDPIKKRIRSWSFDSQGGAGEGVWRKDNQRWLVDSTEVTADGQKSQIAAVYTPIDENRFRWEVTGSPVSQSKPVLMRIEFQRAPDGDE